MHKLTKNPKISVVLPSYNYGWCLHETLHSLENQTFRDFEVIVVDDGSTDNSLHILQKWKKKTRLPFRVLSHQGGENRGLPETYRLGIHNAEAPWIAFLEADDQWLPDALSAKWREACRHPHAGVVFSDYAVNGNYRSRIFWSLYRLNCRRYLQPGRSIGLFRFFLWRNMVASFSNFMAKKDLLLQMPLSPPRNLYYDWWLLAHLAAATPFLYVNRKLTLWRIHRRSANYGPVTRERLHYLHDFLKSLHHSLLKQSLNRSDYNLVEKSLGRVQRFGRFLSNPGCGTFLPFFAENPVHSLKFALHILLKNCLTKAPLK